MKTIHEQVDDETYIDFILEPKDFTKLQDQSLEPTQIILNNQVINVWIRPATARELYEEWPDG